MRKYLIIASIFATSLLLSSNSNAQIKIGSFDEESVLGLMPGIQKVDTILQRYVEDSLKVEYEYELSEYKRKDSMIKDSSKPMNASLKTIIQKELSQHLYKIQNWQQYQNQRLQQKQEELLVPYRQKVYEVLREIIADQKYTHVFKSEVFFAPVPLDDNLSLKVAKKLKLKLPAEVEEALRQQQEGGKPSGAPATSRPLSRPPVKH